MKTTRIRGRRATAAALVLWATVLAAAAQAGAQDDDALLYVSDVKNKQVVRFDDEGNFIDVFVAPGSGGLEHPIDMVRGPDGNGDGYGDLLVASRGEEDDLGAILRYDGVTGAFLDVFAADPVLDWPHDMHYGPDGNLFVAGVRSDNVVSFDGATGALVGEFVPAGSGGLDAPHGMAFGPDLDADDVPDLYVGSRDTDEVLAYSGATGGALGVFVTAGDGGLSKPHDLLFDGEGRLLVTSHMTDEVLRYDDDGAFLDVLVTAGSGGLTRPHSMVFGPGKHLLVTSVMTDEVLRYHKRKGKFLGVFASGNGLEQPHGIAFLSEEDDDD